MNGRNGEPIVAEHNGYVGTAYGVSSYAIRDPRGKEIFHTGFTTFPVDTEEKTKKYLIGALNGLVIPAKTSPQEDDYVKGLKDAWEMARHLRHPSYPGGLYEKDKEKIFGYRDSDQILTNLEPWEAIERYKIFETEQAIVRPGDEVLHVDPTGHTKRYVITCVENDRYGWIDGEGHTGCFDGRMFHKTGRFFPEIKKLKEAMSCAK